MSNRRGTTNRDDRGNTKDREARRRFLLAEFGDGTTARCRAEVHHEDCPGELDETTVTADRHPVAGVDGGRYVRGNIRPVSMMCNALQGGLMAQARKLR